MRKRHVFGAATSVSLSNPLRCVSASEWWELNVRPPTAFHAAGQGQGSGTLTLFSPPAPPPSTDWMGSRGGPRSPAASRPHHPAASDPGGRPQIPRQRQRRAGASSPFLSTQSSQPIAGFSIRLLRSSKGGARWRPMSILDCRWPIRTRQSNRLMGEVSRLSDFRDCPRMTASPTGDPRRGARHLRGGTPGRRVPRQ